MTNSTQPAKILIVDDHQLVRDGLALRISLHADFVVCGEAEGEDQALALVASTQPDLVLVDISLKQGNGIDLIKRVKAQHPAVKMLVVSGFQESLYAERALRAGAHGFLNKQESSENLVEALRYVLEGRRYVSPTMAQRLLDYALGASDESKTPIERLSDRELQIFRLIGQGLTTGAIAEQLIISTHTIDTHRDNIKRKLGLKNSGELHRAAVQWVIENG